MCLWGNWGEWIAGLQVNVNSCVSGFGDVSVGSAKMESVGSRVSF